MKSKSTLLLMSILAFGPSLYAQEPGAKGFDPNFYSDLFGNMTLIAGGVVILGTILYLAYAFSALMRVYERQILEERGEEYVEEITAAPQKSFWERWYKKATNVVPIDREEDIMLDHNYDGIRELDNSLPPWWVAMFYITIFIGSAYFMYYHFLDMGYSSTEHYAIEMEYAEKQKIRMLLKQANSVNENNVVALTEAEDLAAGKTIFINSCAACHGQLGEGGVGPNMTDAYWVHGGDVKSIFKTIKYGVPEKGMIAWKTQLSPVDIHLVASYILTLVGTNPPNGKKPEGELFEAASE